MNHPELAQLWEYLEAPEAAALTPLLDHLTDCAPCRTRAARLAALQNRLQDELPRLGATPATDADALDVARWLDGATNSHDMARDPRLHNPAWLKAALHYLVHRSVLQRDLPDVLVAPASNAKRAAPATPFLHRLTMLFTWRVPVWIPAATAAALMWVALGLPLLTTNNDAVPPPLASYQDAPVMRFQSASAAPPGIGFFAAANSIERPFTGVQLLRPRARELELRWPAVENAAEYHVTLYRIVDHSRETVAEQGETAPRALFNNFDFAPNRRYEWEISGSTRDGVRFRANGGFIAAESQHLAGKT